jgi:hypothetical protein
MAQLSSIRLFGMAPVDGRWDNLVRFAVKVPRDNQDENTQIVATLQRAYARPRHSSALHVRWRCLVADCLLARGHRMDAFGAVGCGSWHP